jgi:serine protease Do
VVSAINRSLEEPGKVGLSDLIQTDAAVNLGNSGGPLVNAEGTVVGINIAITPSVHGVGFAMAINRVKLIAAEIVEKGKVIRPWLGIVPISIGRVLAEVYNLGIEAGVLVADVEKGSPAELAGLVAGDIIVSVAGEKIKNFTEFLSSITKKRMGETVELGIRRNKKPLIVSLILQQLPSVGSRKL